MRKLGWLLIVVGFSLIFGALYMAIIAKPSEYGINNKVVFSTEQEYSQFKWSIGNKDVKINKITVLSSEPPVVVDFSVRFPDTVNFPYGEKYPTAFYTSSGYWILVVGGACLCVFGIIIKSVKKEMPK